MFQLQFLVQRNSNMLIFETIFEKVSQIWFMLIHAYFQAMLIFKQALIIARVRLTSSSKNLELKFNNDFTSWIHRADPPENEDFLIKLYLIYDNWHFSTGNEFITDSQ